MVAITTASSKRMKSMELAATFGLMASTMKANGRGIRCMARVCSHGKTENVTRDNLSKTNEKAMELSPGLMVDNTLASGGVGSKMAKEPSSPLNLANFYCSFSYSFSNLFLSSRSALLAFLSLLLYRTSKVVLTTELFLKGLTRCFYSIIRFSIGPSSADGCV